MMRAASGYGRVRAVKWLQAAAATTALAVTAGAADAATKDLTDEEVTAAVKAVIAERSADGVFAFTDARTGDRLSLVLDDVRIVRGLPVYGWFPNVAFHDKADAGEEVHARLLADAARRQAEADGCPHPQGAQARRNLVDEPDACAARLVVAADDEARQRCRRPAGLASHGRNPHAHRRRGAGMASSHSEMRSGASISRGARRRASAGGNVKDRCQVLCLCRFSQVGK